MRPRYPIWLFVVLLLVAGSAQAAHPNCTPPPPDPPYKDYVFDLATGSPKGEPSYDLEDRVRVVFLNRNPFLQYDIQIVTTEAQEPALTAFTSLFSILTQLPAPSGAAAAPPTPRTSLAAMGENDPRKPCEDSLQAARRALTDAVRKFNQVQSSAATVNTRLTSVRTKLTESQAIFESAGASCELLQTTGNSFAQAVEDAKLDDALTAYQTAYKDLLAPDAAVDQLNSALIVARTNCSQYNDALQEIATLDFAKSTLFGSDKVEEIRKQRQSFETAVKESKDKAENVKKVLKEPRNFYTLRPLPPVETRSETKVTVKIKKPSDAQFPTSPAYAFSINHGGPSRFALSVGVANSWLDSPEYEAISGIPLDADGNPEANATVTRVIGLKEDSDYRITPMLILNTRLRRDKDIHFSFGLSGKVDNKGFDVEYLGGFSYSFGHNRAFVTVGAYNGRVQELQRGFRLGSKLPTDVATVPVRKDREWAPMIAISYRVR